MLFKIKVCLKNALQNIFPKINLSKKINILNTVKSLSVFILFFFGFVTLLPTVTFAQKQVSTAKKVPIKKKERSEKVMENLTFAKPVERADEAEHDGPQERLDYEFNRTKNPQNNTVPKFMMLQALKQYDKSVFEQKVGLERMPSLNSINKVAGVNGINTPIGSLTWTERGPNKSTGPGNDNNPSISGRSDAIWIDLDATKPNQAFVGSNNGGLWTCTDITQASPAWTYIDNFANIAISSICQDPTNTNIMYFGTGEKLSRVLGGGIWKSIDHGVTWNFLSNTTSFYNVTKVLCDKMGNLYVGMVQYVKTGSNFTNGGLMRSIDGGTNFTDITPTVHSINSRQVSDMVYDASIDRMGVYMGYQYTGETQGYCYGSPSTIASGSWNTPANLTVGLGLFAQPNNKATRIRQTVMSAKGGKVWALQGYSGGTASVNGGSYTNLYYSADGGATWTQRGQSITSSFFDAGQNWYALGIDCDPQQPATNVVIGGLNPFKSTNGGATFNQVARWTGSFQGGPVAQYVHADIHNIYYNTTAAGLNRVICMDDGGINYSADGGTTWTDRNAGLRTFEFYSVATNPSDANNYLAGAQDNGSHQFTQPGLGPTFQVSGGDGAFVAIDQLTPNNQITAYVYNVYFVCTDKGVNLNNSFTDVSIDNTGEFINPFDLDGKTKKLYSSTSAGQFLRWDDPFTTQNTFPKITVPAISGYVISAITVSPNLNNTIYLAAGGIVVKATNANTASPTFTTITPPATTAGSNISSIVVGPQSNDQDLVVTSSSYGTKKVFISSDGGINWTDITGDLPDMPVNWAAFFAGSNTQITLATNLGVWFTSQVNGTSTHWLADAGIPKVECRMLKYSDATNTLALATYGRGLWTAKTSTTPKISFYPALLATSKSAGIASANCRMYFDYSDSVQISDLPTGAATVTLSVLSGGTAIPGADFDFTTNGSFTSPSKTIVFNSANYRNKIPITIRVYNNKNKNAVVPLTVNLGIAVTGNTDAQKSMANQNLLINLTDNLVPIPTTTTTSQTVWTEDWEAWPNSKSDWVFLPDLSNAPISAALFAPSAIASCSTQEITNITVELFSTDAFGNLAFCGSNATNSNPLFYRTINGRDNYYANMKVTFDYISLNGSDNNKLVYSKDNGLTWITIQNFPTQNTLKNVTVAIPTTLNNANFLLGWSSAGSNLSGFGIDDISFIADITPPIIETAVSSATNYYLNSGIDIDAYSNNNNILANISNPSADLGCVTAAVENAGNIWPTYFNGTRSQKTFVLTPEKNASGTTYSATFYFTNAELAGHSPSNLKLAKTEASSIASSTSTNTIALIPTTTTYNTTGVTFTGSFTGFSRYFLIDQFVVLPIKIETFTGSLVEHNIILNWRTSSEFNNKEFDVQWCMDGINFTTIGIVASKGNSSIDVDYTYTHNHPANGVNYYRLKQQDKDGHIAYSAIVAIRVTDSPVTEPFLYPNPAKKSITINLGTLVPQMDLELYNADMHLLRKQNLSGAGQTTKIDISQLPSGVYFIQINKNGSKIILRFIKD